MVRRRLRDTRRLRDLAAMFLARGAPLLAAHLRAKRRGTVSVKWQAEETSGNVNGR